MSLFKKFANDESGATAIEYGLIAALISVVIIGVVFTLGENLSNTFESISNQLPSTVTPAGGTPAGE